MSSNKLQVGKEERVLTWITSSSPESRRRAKSHISNEIKRRKATASARVTRLKNSRTLAPAPSKSAQATDQIPSPVSILGAGRVDPFANYPVCLKADEHLDLVDHCTSLNYRQLPE